MFGFLKKKRDILPPLPDELPTFPSPEDLGDLDLPSSKNLLPMKIYKESDLPQVRETDFDSRKIQEVPMPIRKINKEDVFLRIETFRDVVDSVNSVKGSLEKTSRIITEVENLEDEQAKQYKRWHDVVKDAHDRILYVDQILFRR